MNSEKVQQIQIETFQKDKLTRFGGRFFIINNSIDKVLEKCKI